MQDGDTQEYRQPLPYHFAIRDYLQSEESQIWKWYSSNRVRSEQTEAIRFELLKSTYRLDRASHPQLYATVDEVARQLALAIPITLYQAQNPEGLNASTAFIPDEAHIIFHGPITAKLSGEELKALLAHELGHTLLYSQGEGELLIAEQVLSAMTHDRQADIAHYTSARLFGLYTEVYCDRIALSVLGSPLDVISMLVKVATGLDEVDPHSYLKQANEILGKGPIKTAGLSHPEAYIRAHALELWHNRGPQANARIAELIEGPPALDELDLTGQVRVMQTTYKLIAALLTPTWLHTDALLAHARLYFADFKPVSEARNGSALREEILRGDKGLLDYYCYVLLDFASADRDLEEAPLAQAVGLAESLGLRERFVDLAAKELKLRKKQLEDVFANRETIIAAAAQLEAGP